MKVWGSNDILEILKLGEGERPNFMTHNLSMLDQRADWALHLLQSWGMAAAMGDILAQVGCEEHKHQIRQVPPQELVMRICEVVDAIWNEMQHRGWIINSKSIGE